MKIIVRVNNVQGKADNSSAFIQIKSIEGHVSKIAAPTLAAILRPVEWTEDSFARTGVLYAPMTVYGIVDLHDEQVSVRTGVFFAGADYKIVSVRNGEMVAVDVGMLLTAMADDKYSEVHTILQDDDLQYSDFWGWDIPESHVEAIIRAWKHHNNGKQTA